MPRWYNLRIPVKDEKTANDVPSGMPFSVADELLKNGQGLDPRWEASKSRGNIARGGSNG